VSFLVSCSASFLVVSLSALALYFGTVVDVTFDTTNSSADIKGTRRIHYETRK
jgi:hypothetical protein